MSKFVNNFFFFLSVTFLLSPVAFSQEEKTILQKPNPSQISNEEFYPLNFELPKESFEKIPIEIVWDLETNQGKALNMGPFVFSSDTFSAVIKGFDSEDIFTAQAVNENAKSLALGVRWPLNYFNEFKVEVLTKNGFVIWEYSVFESDIERWSKAIKGKQGVNDDFLKKSNYVISEIENKGFDFKKIQDSFRICIASLEKKFSTKMCSAYYGVKNKKAKQIAKLKQNLVPRILVQGDEVPFKGLKNVSKNEFARLFTQLSTGETFEFTSEVVSLPLMDISVLDSQNYRIVLSEVKPFDENIVNIKKEETGLVSWIGFQATIGDFRKLWKVIVRGEEPYVYFPGAQGGILRQKLPVEEIPNEKNRILGDLKTPHVTYSSSLKIFAKKNPNIEVTSAENEVELDENKEDFLWRLKTTEYNKLNKSYLLVKDSNKTYKVFHEVYRSFSSEISSRMSLILTGTKSIIMGEMAFNHWFEDILGWSQYTLSRHRWGFSYKYFKSISKLTDGVTDITSSVSDLKYRLSPGVWGRDESVGFILSHQAITLGVSNANSLGGGLFWARSMPAIFDELFNIIPLMRYPKWVDMEFIYYTTPLQSYIKIKDMYSMNFHGKVFWSHRVFGEAGFGLKAYGYEDSQSRLRGSLKTFYGTVGLGVNF